MDSFDTHSALSRPFDQLSRGDAFTTRGRTITEADVVAFGAQTGDLRPQHVDARWAEANMFGERIAHGMLVISYAIGLLPLDPDRALALRRFADAIFTRPVKIGDTIYADGSIESLTAVDSDKGVVTLCVRVRNQDAQLVCRVRMEVLWRR